MCASSGHDFRLISTWLVFILTSVRQFRQFETPAECRTVSPVPVVPVLSIFYLRSLSVPSYRAPITADSSHSCTDFWHQHSC